MKNAEFLYEYRVSFERYHQNLMGISAEPEQPLHERQMGGETIRKCYWPTCPRACILATTRSTTIENN